VNVKSITNAGCVIVRVKWGSFVMVDSICPLTYCLHCDSLIVVAGLHNGLDNACRASRGWCEASNRTSSGLQRLLDSDSTDNMGHETQNVRYHPIVRWRKCGGCLREIETAGVLSIVGVS
jgi:hypothetical protein